MGALVKVYVYSFLVCLVFIGVWFSIDFMRMDNASKHWAQSIYYIILLVLALIGNIGLFTRSVNAMRKNAILFDFSVALITLSIGLIGIFWLNGGQFSAVPIGSIVVLTIGIIGIVKTVMKARHIIV